MQSNTKFLVNLLILDLNFAIHEFRAPLCIHSTVMFYYVSDIVKGSGSRMMTDVRIIKTVILLTQMFQT